MLVADVVMSDSEVKAGWKLSDVTNSVKSEVIKDRNRRAQRIKRCLIKLTKSPGIVRSSFSIG